MHTPESVLENETLNILSDFEIQTDQPITARQPDFVIINKHSENLLVDFAVPANHRVEMEEN